MPSNSGQPGALRTWVPRVDEGVLRLVRLAVPAGLLLAIASGVALPYLQAPAWPYADVRSAHVLAGWVIGLALAYRALLGLPGLVAWLLRVLRGQAHALRWPGRRPAGLLLLACLHGLLLLALLASGALAEWLRRGGGTPPGLPAVLVPALHAVLAPYYGTALLLHWFFKGRLAWRRVLQELQSP